MKTTWDNVDHFEELVADYAGSKYAVAVDSCTNAIFLCLQYYINIIYKKYYYWNDVGSIRIPRRTYISVPMQIAHSGLKIEFSDEDWTGTYRLYPFLIIDSAQRFTKNMYIPRTFQCLSFHTKKILSIGRGGMILTDDINAVNWFRASRHDGRSSIYYNDLTNNGPGQLGWHMYMTPEQAVRGIEQFYGLPEVNEDSGCASDYQVDLSTLSCFDEYLI